VLPLAVDVSDWPVLLVGDGPAALKRLALLQASGARHLTVYAAEPSQALREAAGALLVPRLPSDDEVIAARLLFLAGLPDAENERLVALARAHRVLANAEDVPHLCDAYALATVRRGNLVLAVSTEGRSPAAARVLRQWLERRFGPEWEQRLEDAAALRNRLRAEGAKPAEITAATAALLAPHLGES
jgi:precorrin-2 dehydrogenase / sirohydrochlorin ferrochelatase